MIARLVLATVVAIVVGLGCLFVGEVLIYLHIPIATLVGDFLRTFAWAFGILAGLWYFFGGGVPA